MDFAVQNRGPISVAMVLVAACFVESWTPSHASEYPWWATPPYNQPIPDTTGENSALVCVGEITGHTTTGPLPLGPFDDWVARGPHHVVEQGNGSQTVLDKPSGLYHRARLLHVLKGTEKEGGQILIWGGHRLTGIMKPGTVCLVKLNRLPEGCYMATDQVEFLPHSPANLTIPDEAPLLDRMVLVRLSVFHTSEKYARSVLASLWPGRARIDSPYYDLMAIFLQAPATSPSLTTQALHIRMLWGDTAALGEAIDVSRRSGQTWSLEGLGDDAATTLNLILEGKRWPWMDGSRLSAAKQLSRIAHPSSLPYAVKAMDDPDSRIRWYAYFIADSIRKSRESPPPRGFLADSYRTAETPLSAEGKRLIDEMKQWWETEGKRQFDYVLPKEE